MRFTKYSPLVISLFIASQIHTSINAQSPEQERPRNKNGVSKQKTIDNQQSRGASPSQSSADSVKQEKVSGNEGGDPQGEGEKIKLTVDLVVLDAQVMQQKTGRVVGDLKKEDFILQEDGVKQQITHFSQDALPLSVILLVDRGGCLDPFGEQVRHATLEALARLRPQDEVALMAFHNTVGLISGFSSDKRRIANALNRMPPHDEAAEHCFNRAFYEAADYMRRAGNPDGRRVIIMITGITTSFDCSGPTAEDARLAILESGSVVCGIIQKSSEQRMESGAMRAVTGIAGIFKVKTSNLKQLADETGGEILSDKPENLDQTFDQLIDHLRTRYSIGFVSTNTKRDGSFRKLKVEVAQQAQKDHGKLIVKTRRGYIAAKSSSEKFDRESKH